MKCPQCNSAGEIIASHVSYANGKHGYDVPLKCSQCDGEGTVPDESVQWIKDGENLRYQRVNGQPYRNMLVMAKLLDLSGPAELSRMERGVIDPIIALKRLAALTGGK